MGPREAFGLLLSVLLLSLAVDSRVAAGPPPSGAARRTATGVGPVPNAPWIMAEIDTSRDVG